MKAEDCKVGKEVFYFKTIKDNGALRDPIVTEITSEVWKLENGEEVCKVKDVIGGVSIRHLVDPVVSPEDWAKVDKS